MKTKQEHKPLTKIGNTFFNVDVFAREFIMAGRPSHIVSFDHMVYHGTHYTMPFDLFERKPPTPGVPLNEDVVQAEIRQLVEIAPAEMAERYKVSILDIKRYSDFDLIVDQERYALREKGYLLSMMVADRYYQVDLDNDHLAGNHNYLPLSDFIKESDGSRYAYLDTHTHRLIKINPATIIEMPGPEVVKIRIPANSLLDPYFEAGRQGVDVRTYLMGHPFEKDLKAQIIPLYKTMLPVNIRNNSEKEIRLRFEADDRVRQRHARNALSRSTNSM